MRKCYPKYSYLLYLFISILFVFLSILPMCITTDEKWIYKVLWSFLMLLLAIMFMVGFLVNLQHYKIVDNTIIVFNVFGKISEIDLTQAVYDIQKLDTYFSWIISIPQKWICIYEKNQFYDKFTFGCSNKKNVGRIQIIYSDELMNELERRNVGKCPKKNV